MATKKQQRIARLMQVGNAQVLTLTDSKGLVAYRLQALDHGFGEAAYRLEKANRGDGPGEVYDVLIDGARSSCECKGFLRWRHCKHIESIEALIAAGKLPSCKKAAPKQPWCKHCQDNPETYCTRCSI